jgi:hypothetical protein
VARRDVEDLCREATDEVLERILRAAREGDLAAPVFWKAVAPLCRERTIGEAEVRADVFWISAPEVFLPARGRVRQREITQGLDARRAKEGVEVLVQVLEADQLLIA